MSTLYIVPTPIGNIEDITIRALNILKQTKNLVCEDTRVAGKLLKLHDIDSSSKKLLPLYEPKEEMQTAQILTLLLQHENVALISDSGTPIISDPGFILVREIREKFNEHIKIEVLPGATSITTALVTSGLPTDKFTFLGFLPRKNSHKVKLFENLVGINSLLKTTFIAFESPHRIEKTIKLLTEQTPNAKIAVCRELTKKFEQVEVGTPPQLLQQIQSGAIPVKGEFVILLNY